MQLSLIQIGNSRGIRIPAKILESLGFKDKIEIKVIEDLGILIKPADRKPREGWDEAFKKMHENGDDTLLISENLDNEYLAEIEW